MQMLSSLNKTFKAILLLSPILLFSSCQKSKSEQANKNFLKKYGSEIKKINSKREEMNSLNQKQKLNKSWRSLEEVSEIQNDEFINNAKNKLVRPPAEILPNYNASIQSQYDQVPEDMFFVNYNLQNFPDQYAKQKLSFDDIIIPSQDSFGVETELGEKNYQLINHKILQQNIDFTKQNIGQTEKDISLKIIREEKKARNNNTPSNKSESK